MWLSRRRRRRSVRALPLAAACLRMSAPGQPSSPPRPSPSVCCPVPLRRRPIRGSPLHRLRCP
eukprot:5835139-Pleurochrysis_carterae.AAC.1